MQLHTSIVKQHKRVNCFKNAYTWGQGDDSMGKSTCSASMRTWVQIPSFHLNSQHKTAAPVLWGPKTGLQRLPAPLQVQRHLLEGISAEKRGGQRTNILLTPNIFTPGKSPTPANTCAKPHTTHSLPHSLNKCVCSKPNCISKLLWGPIYSWMTSIIWKCNTCRKEL